MHTGCSDKILFSDEAYFKLNGFVNRQNYRTCSSENPRLIVEKLIDPQSITVRYGFWAGGIIGSFFFKNVSSQAMTVNSAGYRDVTVLFLCQNCKV